jgi:hypothetical protein
LTSKDLAPNTSISLKEERCREMYIILAHSAKNSAKYMHRKETKCG